MIQIRRPAVREMTIEALLQWTFGEQCARLDIDATGDDWNTRTATGAEWLIWQRGAVMGCAIDGGLGFLPGRVHDDAETVAGVVAAVLPSYRSFWVAQLAAAGRRPDAMLGQAPACVPRGFHTNPHGIRAATQPAVPAQFAGGVWQRWMPVAASSRRAARRYALTPWEVEQRRFLGHCTPVTYEPTRQQIEGARRAYLEWWAALHEVRLRMPALRDHKLSATMPPVAPWEVDG